MRARLDGGLGRNGVLLLACSRRSAYTAKTVEALSTIADLLTIGQVLYWLLALLCTLATALLVYIEKATLYPVPSWPIKKNNSFGFM